MNTLLHLPALRRGRIYESLDRLEVKCYGNGKPRATVSQVNAGIIRRDLKKIGESGAILRGRTAAGLLEICSRAGEVFLNGTVPLGRPGQTQSAAEYIETLSSTSGLPHVMVKRNMAKIHHALTQMKGILQGLTRGLDLAILDRGFGEQNGSLMSFYPTARALGLVMPSNSPAVNSLWLAAIPLKTPVVVKPGKDEPWTPWRLIQSFIAAGCPAEAFCFYPTDHEGAGEILRTCERAVLFGDRSTTQSYTNHPGIELHGPGYSKILIGEDQVERWPEFIELMAASIVENGGRSCINTSTVVTPKHGAEIAEALAQRLGPIAPLPASDDKAALSAFANPRMAESIDATIEEGLRTPGAIEVTSKHRAGPRKTTFEGGTYLRPSIVLCDSFEHPLAIREFLFPYASVLEVPQSRMLEKIGPSLVVTAITTEAGFQRQLLESPMIERLNLGPVPTTRISWEQPHEGNLFEFLWKRRAIEKAPV